MPRPFGTELANRERSKRERLLRRARFPVVKSLDGYDFSNVRLPDGYALDGLLDLDFVPRAQDLVFYGKTGRGKTHLAIGLGMRAVERGMNVRSTRPRSSRSSSARPNATEASTRCPGTSAGPT